MHTCMENTLHEAEEKVLSRKTLETPITKEKTDKREREDDSQLMKVSSKEFKYKIRRKRRLRF